MVSEPVPAYIRGDPDLTDIQSIPAAFRAAVARHADQPLIVTPEERLSFAEIDRASGRLAAGLAGQGIVPGDRVALYCVNSPHFVTAYLGIVKTGAVVVPLNLLIADDELVFILGDAGVRAIVYHEALAPRVSAFRGAATGLQGFIAIGAGKSDPGDLEFTALIDPSAGAPTREIDPATDPEKDLAAILYTSGTTGRPKGAMLSHANLVSNTASVRQALALRPGEDRLLVVLPMFHSFAATVGLLTPALHGLSLVPVPKFDPTMVSSAIAATGATVFLGVPSMYNVILRLPEEQRAQWRSIRYGVAGGAAMPIELLRRFEASYGFPILEGDGPTECSPVTCVNPLEGVRKPASVGLPLPGVEMRILDKAGRSIPDGESGEICVRGPNVMRGDWGLPEATAESFFDDWFRTGDLGYCDGDGYFFMVDRIKDMIIVNGMNVYPRMIEEVLYRHPKILEAAVVGEPHASHGEIVVAYLVPVAGSELGAAEVKAFCKEHLGPHQRPRTVLIRESLPKNATGKILKRELRREGEIQRGVDLS